MNTNRLEAFSDGVLAIIITIMVLEMKVPHEATLAALGALWPVFLSYVLSFIYVGIYWNNHHHMLAVTRSPSGGIQWANLHLLFWLSMLPFTTGWMGENHFARLPSVLYGFNLLACAAAYYILQRQIIRHEGPDCLLARAVGNDRKGKLTWGLYSAGIAGAWFIVPWMGAVFFAIVAAIWVIPDARIERVLGRSENSD
ncbi:MAG: TMEM175 family protein [Erythrobacter sp.]